VNFSCKIEGMEKGHNAKGLTGLRRCKRSFEKSRFKRRRGNRKRGKTIRPYRRKRIEDEVRYRGEAASQDGFHSGPNIAEEKRGG